MSTRNPAAQALIEALKDPGLSDAARGGLVAALQAVTASAQPTTVQARAPTKVQSDKVRGERVLLTKGSVEALPLPAKGERLVYDTQTPQLAVRLRPSGRTYIAIMWDRERHRKTTRTLGKCKGMTPEQARKAAQLIVGKVADGQDIRRDRDAGMTVREMLAAWHAEKVKTTRTAGELQDKVLTYLEGLADRPAIEIEREHVGRIHHRIATYARKRVYKTIKGEVRPVEIGEPGLAATADKWRASLHAVYVWAQGKGLVDANPCEGIPNAFDAKRAARTNYLRGDELLRFWKALEADTDADVRDALYVLLYTGQRRGNVLEMRWSDVDLGAGVWSLSAQQTKQSKAQTTPLVAQAREILQRRYESAGTKWVFPATRGDGPMSETRLRGAWARICTAAGISDLRPHDLRHTSGSWLARLGVSEAVRQKALGHATPAMSARYAHLELDPVADALQRVADAVQAAATNPPARVRKFKATK
jgi:integrase